MSAADLVSIVIPAYNAAPTLDQTLRSVRSQTHRNLDIIVVDDGSTDATPLIADRHAAADRRVRIFRQDNGGVAAARNTGWQQARSEIIAFIDADDLWAPTKIERQFDVLCRADQQVGLVYCWFVRIDSRGIIVGMRDGVHYEGDVLTRLFAGNFIGNGSTAMVRRHALAAVNGFDSRLRARAAEGCEDFLLHCRIAESYHFAVVPERLVGYRFLPGNMSSNRAQMLRSWFLVVEEMQARYPSHRDILRRGLRSYTDWVVHDLMINDIYRLPSIFWLLFRVFPLLALKIVAIDMPLTLVARLRNQLRNRLSTPRDLPQPASQPFLIGDPDLWPPIPPGQK